MLMVVGLVDHMLVADGKVNDEASWKNILRSHWVWIVVCWQLSSSILIIII